LAFDIKEGFLKTSDEQINEMLDVNIKAIIHVLRFILPEMIKQKNGHVVEIGSIAGLYPLGLPVYGATKGAVHSLSGHLRLYLSGAKIRYTEICPGRTNTNFFDNALSNQNDRSIFTSENTILSPEDIASAVLYALTAPMHVNIGMVEITAVDQALGGQIWS